MARRTKSEEQSGNPELLLTDSELAPAPEAPAPEPAPAPRSKPFVLKSKKGQELTLARGPLATDLAAFLEGAPALGFRTVATKSGEELRVLRLDGQQFVRVLGASDVVS